MHFQGETEVLHDQQQCTHLICTSLCLSHTVHSDGLLAVGWNDTKGRENGEHAQYKTGLTSACLLPAHMTKTHTYTHTVNIGSK